MTSRLPESAKLAFDEMQTQVTEFFLIILGFAVIALLFAKLIPIKNSLLSEIVFKGLLLIGVIVAVKFIISN